MTTRPGDLKEIRTYLTAEDFTHPLHGQLFRCLTALHHRGDPIDPITVVWEAQHRGLLTRGEATPEDILTTCVWSGNDPAYWATRVLRHALLTTAATTADRIDRLAADPTLTPHQLITASRRSLGDLTSARLRWHHAHHSPPPPPRPRNPPSPLIPRSPILAKPSAVRALGLPRAAGSR